MTEPTTTLHYRILAKPTAGQPVIGDLCLITTTRQQATEACDLFRRLVRLSDCLRLEATMELGIFQTTYRIDDPDPDMAVRWVDEVAMPLITTAFPPPAAPAEQDKAATEAKQ